MPHFHIPFGENEAHAASLAAGLRKLPEGFTARLCGLCGGHGQYRQMYTAGCGGGYYRAMGDCDHCDGTGLIQGRSAAPASVREQVLNAARD